MTEPSEAALIDGLVARLRGGEQFRFGGVDDANGQVGRPTTGEWHTLRADGGEFVFVLETMSRAWGATVDETSRTETRMSEATLRAALADMRGPMRGLVGLPYR